MFPLVSVIITTFNRKRFLRDAIVSVVSQDYEEKEVLVIDDGSDDGSFREIRDLPVRYVWQPNQGISAARNRGIALAQGEYIAFLDVDDFWLKGKLSRQMNVLRQKETPVCYTDEIWIRNEKRINQKKHHAKYSGMIFQQCLPLCIISPSSVVIRKDVFPAVGYFDEGLPVCEDYDMWLRITARYPVFFIPQFLIVKRGGHDDQLSRRYEAMDRFRVESLLKLLGAGVCDEDQTRMAKEELRKKCLILSGGALKRGKKEEARYYEKLANPIFSYPGS